MEVLHPGHSYALSNLDGDGEQQLHFVRRKPHQEPKEGVVNQEVLRVLIDRIQFLDKELPWHGNAEILLCLRKALLLHEIRALERKLIKGEIKPERVHIGSDGHFQLWGK